MRALETTESLILPDTHIAVVGDWHGDAGWAKAVLRALARTAPEVVTVLHVGDFWMDLRKMDQIADAFSIERVLWTVGNHEPFPAITPLAEAHPGQAIRVSQSVWLLPRPFRFTVGGRQILSLGGATSVDRYWRSPGEWHPEESITDEQVATAQAGGRADIFVTHESPARTPVQAVKRILRTNPLGFPKESLVESAASRVRVAKVSEVVQPSIHLHGHMHAPGAGVLADGRRIISLGCNGQQSNLAIVDLANLSIDTPSLREIRSETPRETRLRGGDL
ncbi:metallophosphoesterase [Microbacterium sp. NPDC079995]|uniref:metallophosphoesterase family protein n=1 Tax=unclassified Microbacterium TaxID=2609290 RepID=UPI00344E61F7